MTSYERRRDDEMEPRRDREWEDAPERREPEPVREPETPRVARENPDFDRDEDDAEPDEDIVEERERHPAVEDERHRKRRDGLYI